MKVIQKPIIGAFLFAFIILIASVIVLRTGTANIRDVTDTMMLEVGRKAGLELNSYHLVTEDGHGGVVGYIKRLTSPRLKGAIDFPDGCMVYVYSTAGIELQCSVCYHNYEVYCMEIEYPLGGTSEARRLKEAIRSQFRKLQVTMKQRS